MTVGIYLANGLEAVVITDSRVSSGIRQSDSVDKLGRFSNTNYHGAIFGTGIANTIERLFKKLDDTSGVHLEEFAQGLKQPLQDWAYQSEQEWLDAQKKDIEKAAFLIQEPRKKVRFIEKLTKQIQEKYLMSKQHDREHDRYIADFALVAFDKEADRIKAFRINEQGVTPWESAHIEIGSGNDGANLYFSKELQGLDSKRLTLPQLAFFAMNAYSNSTVNRGVGGTPKVARISAKGCNVLPTRDARLLANLSGIYLSGLRHSKLPKEKLQFFIKGILDKQEPYGLISRALRIDESMLTRVYIPYSSWQETANSR